MALSPEMVTELLEQKTDGPTVLGDDPETNLPILLKEGPYGPYVQLGDGEQNGKKKPKRVSLLKGMKSEDIDRTMALKLLSLPRTLGNHPESGKVVKAGVGRYGPYVVYDSKYVSIKAPDDVLEIQLDRALEMIAAAGDKKGGGKSVLKELGEHPDGGPIQVLSGRYGPYVKYKKTNASLPKDANPEAMTLEQALALLAEKEGAKKTTKKTTRKTTAKKTATKKTATKKTAVKKATSKKAG